jgi:hypothetical protein
MNERSSRFRSTERGATECPDGDALTRVRQAAVEPFYPADGGFGKLNLGDARKAIRAYRKASGDAFGTLDALLAHLEAGVEFGREFGAVDRRFEEALLAALGDAAKIFRTAEGGELYSRVQGRLHALAEAAGDLDGPLGDATRRLVARLEAAFSGGD